MKTVINKILSPYTTLSKIFPPDIALPTLKTEIRNAVRLFSKGVRPAEKPYLINICGLPASGKTHLCRQIKEEHAELLYISFDALMEELPSYRADCEKKPAKRFRTLGTSRPIYRLSVVEAGRQKQMAGFI